MPHAEKRPILPPAKVVVTGANGFIASHTVQTLLEAGYRVVGTVRTGAKAEDVKETFKQLLPDQSHLLTLAVIPDITQRDAYVELFREYEPSAVLHLASPFTYATNNFERDLMEPAVQGTLAVLHAASLTPSIKRIVHTNSFACIYDASLGLRPGYTYTAADWCPLTYSDGASAPNAPVAYRASKAVAEKTAWNYIKEHQTGFDVVSLCPAMVFGPFLDTSFSLPRIDSLNTSNKLVWDVVSAGSGADVPPTKGPVWIDVRDVADAHVKAIQMPELGGQRFLLAKGIYCSQEIADVSRSVASEWQSKIPVGKPGSREAEKHFGVDARREERLLAAKESWRTLETTMRDLVPQLHRINAHS